MASGISGLYLYSTLRVRPGLLTPRRSSRVTIFPGTYHQSRSITTALPSKSRASTGAKKTESTTNASSTSNTNALKPSSRSKAGYAKSIMRYVAEEAPPPEEQMRRLDRILILSDSSPTTDFWGQSMRTLDVIIPHPVLSSRRRLHGIRAIWSQFLQNRLNDLKNITSLAALASCNGIPGVSTENLGFFRKLFTWPFYIFGTKSTRPTSWLTYTRELALDTYRQFNTAIARNDVKEIKRLAIDSFLNNTLSSQRKRPTGYTYVWRFHREVNPTQILSLRVTEGNFAPEDPKFGNRLMVHALVKFDTEESLEIYDRQGNAVHKPDAGAIGKKENGSVPAAKQHVIQYLVLEKRMWYDGPWMIRDQLWK